MFRIVFPARLEDSEILQIFQFSSYGINLLVHIATQFTDEEILLGIERMLQEEFFQEFCSTVRSEEFFEGDQHYSKCKIQSAKCKMKNFLNLLDNSILLSFVNRFSNNNSSVLLFRLLFLSD